MKHKSLKLKLAAAFVLAGLTAISVRAQNLYVSEAGGSSAVGEYGLDGSTINASLITGLNFPYGIAISGNNLYVANAGAGTVGEYTTGGATINASLISGVTSAWGIAVAGNDLYVGSAAGGGTVGKYALDGTPINPSLISGLSYPAGIAVSGNDFFVTSFSGGTVGEYGLDGTPINPSLITGLSSPVALAIGMPVPEPSTWALAGLGGMALMILLRRKSSDLHDSNSK